MHTARKGWEKFRWLNEARWIWWFQSWFGKTVNVYKILVAIFQHKRPPSNLGVFRKMTITCLWLCFSKLFPHTIWKLLSVWLTTWWFLCLFSDCNTVLYNWQKYTRENKEVVGYLYSLYLGNSLVLVCVFFFFCNFIIFCITPFVWQTKWMKVIDHWWLMDHTLEFLFHRNSIWRYQMALDGFQWKGFVPYAPFLLLYGTCMLLLPSPLSIFFLFCFSLLFPVVTLILSRDLNSHKIGVWLAIQNSVSVGSCWGSMFMALWFLEDDYAPHCTTCCFMFGDV